MALNHFSLCSLFLFILLSFLYNSIFANTQQKSSIEFLKNIKGGKKGNNIKGIGKLKQYLQYLGYLPSKNSTQQNEDYFDESLESALKIYQLNFNVNASGVLDEPTVSKIAMPRCGVPDIINGTNMMVSKNLNFRSHLHMVSHYSYYGRNIKWPPSKYNLIFAFNKGNSL